MNPSEIVFRSQAKRSGTERRGPCQGDVGDPQLADDALPAGARGRRRSYFSSCSRAPTPCSSSGSPRLSPGRPQLMPPKPKADDPSSLGNLYLIFYNVFLTLGWLIVLIQTVHHLVHEQGNITGLWENTSSVLLIFQTLAVLEIMHSAVGLVSSSVMMVLPQVFSRLMVTWAILYSFEDSRTSIGFPMLLIAWSVTEVIRYSFYFLNILKQVPFLLTFLR
ncbi:very-long-chain (3R)-3-hydroxyacyl-CoA dehydratase hpo-8-like [Penaeus monodon]|uniref:very-long-chain (3R)-3-hydroxyacyl-CoA dehydratase hpo-8-like n=1 Tax=Penaeus monodon TaxID=6687 RepID=UPI0018A6F5F0|nr:very-long-chain (3R)-3-hydroxyacyl-CoA dehydratase hpo-8-like [Penaeus monodon]